MGSVVAERPCVAHGGRGVGEGTVVRYPDQETRLGPRDRRGPERNQGEQRQDDRSQNPQRAATGACREYVQSSSRRTICEPRNANQKTRRLPKRDLRFVEEPGRSVSTSRFSDFTHH